jgi:hypothetical protein
MVAIDPQDLLPPELRARWVVLARAALLGLLLQAALFGAGLALFAGSFFQSSRAGAWLALPIALALMAANALWLRRLDRRLSAGLKLPRGCAPPVFDV